MTRNDLYDTALLATFLAVAESGSFAEASMLINRTPASVSMQMKKLEQMIGPPKLFMRANRKMILSARAKSLIPYIRDVVEANRLLSKAVATGGGTGLLRIGVPEEFTGTIIPAALDIFSTSRPSLEVTTTSGSSDQIWSEYTRGALDIAIVSKSGNRSGLELTNVEPLYWVSAPDCRLEQQEPLQLAVFPDGCGTRQIALDACSYAGIRYHISYSGPSLAGILGMVRTGLAIAPLTGLSIPPDLRVIDGFACVPPLPSLKICLIKSPSARNQIVVDEIYKILRCLLRESSLRQSASVPKHPFGTPTGYCAA
ncbi:LysR substrate-binding domain-containing protein [Agrobacterium vitis]|uniref:LysR substrate-binding domain-containing protein n=1 Tax=Agrobacterium vitis TaxID=373 RepID=UPI003D267537